MKRIDYVTLLGASLLWMQPSISPAREVILNPDPGGAPVIAPALATAAPGDTLHLRKGLYREVVTLTKSVSLMGEAGAVLDPSEPFHPQWEPALAIGKGVYRAAVDRRPRVLCLGGKIVAEIDERRKETQTEGPWFWQRLLATGTRLSGFRCIRAVWIYRTGEQAIYLHLVDDADPRTLIWSCVWSTDPVIHFKAATNAVISGLTLAHGYNGVVLEGGSRRCTVSRCVIGPWDQNGIYLTAGATECLAEGNEVFRGAYEDWVPHNTSRELYEIWQIHKLAGFYDRVGIDLVRAGAGNRIHANHVYETFDGINLGDSSVENLDIPLTRPEDGRDTEIWENVIERTRDSGLELGAGCINVKVHHNVLRQTHGGLRFKLPRLGPVFIYRNLLVDGMPFNIWYSMDDSPAEGYVYHNTIIGGQTALAYTSMNTNRPGILGAAHWHYLNNLVIGKEGFFRTGRTKIPMGFTADFNVVVGGSRPYPDDPTRDSHSRYVEAVPVAPGFPPKPLPGSPAVDAGKDLSTYFHGRPLPGCEPGYFQGKAPDAGALEVE